MTNNRKFTMDGNQKLPKDLIISADVQDELGSKIKKYRQLRGFSQ